MHGSHHDHNDQHEPSIEDVYRGFITKEPSVITLLELDDPDKVANEEKAADEVQVPERVAPPQTRMARQICRVAIESKMKASCERDVDEEDDDLGDQARHDKRRARLLRLDIRAHGTTGDLTDEASNIEEYEQL